MNIFQKTLASVCLIGFTVSSAYAELPQISNARIIQPPPGAKVAAAYFTIKNPGSEALVISAASSDDIPRVSIHLSKVVDDVAKMIEQKSVTVEPGKSLEFTHGSYHLMLMGLKEPLQPGSDISFTIATNQGTIPVAIPVITPDEASKSMSHSMKHGSDKAEGMDTMTDHKEHDSMSHSMDKN